MDTRIAWSEQFHSSGTCKVCSPTCGWSGTNKQASSKVPPTPGAWTGSCSLENFIFGRFLRPLPVSLSPVIQVVITNISLPEWLKPQTSIAQFRRLGSPLSREAPCPGSECGQSITVPSRGQSMSPLGPLL